MRIQRTNANSGNYYEIDDLRRSYRKLIVVGDHTPERTEHIVFVSAPADVERQRMIENIRVDRS